jgi:hypothetical protein
MKSHFLCYGSFSPHYQQSGKNRSQNGFEDDTLKKNPADPAGIILYLKSKVRTGLIKKNMRE